jgi:hypothetical protein
MSNFPRSKREGGHRDVDNAVLAHRLCASKLLGAEVHATIASTTP